MEEHVKTNDKETPGGRNWGVGMSSGLLVQHAAGISVCDIVCTTVQRSSAARVGTGRGGTAALVGGSAPRVMKR